MAPKRVTHIHRGPAMQTHTHTQTQTHAVNCKGTSNVVQSGPQYTAGHKTICKQAQTKYSGALMSAHKCRQHMAWKSVLGCATIP